MAGTLKYDPKHFYDEDAFESFDPVIDEVNDILEGKEVPASCTITNNYLYYLATEYDRLDPPTFMHLPEVEEARQLLKERFDKLRRLEVISRRRFHFRYFRPIAPVFKIIGTFLGQKYRYKKSRPLNIKQLALFFVPQAGIEELNGSEMG